MTKQIKSKGFTIVELLIVIVVIAILAAITIVAYNGIQNRAHTTAQKTAAENVAKKIEAYNAVNSAYPLFYTTPGAGQTITEQLATITDSSLAGSGLTITKSAPSATTKDGTVQLFLCGTTGAPANATAAGGYYISVWDSTLGTAAANPVQAGGTASITAGTPNTVTMTGGATCTATN